MNKAICGFDCDGVLSIPTLGKPRIIPQPDDIIITGRSFEEEEETRAYLESVGIFNEIFFSPALFADKTRKFSGYHKANIINQLRAACGVNIKWFFEDDDIQANIIKSVHPNIEIIKLTHNLVNEENVRRDKYGNEIEG